MGAIYFGLGDFDGDIRCKRAHALEYIEIHNGRITRSHRYDHSLADRAAHPNLVLTKALKQRFRLQVF